MKDYVILVDDNDQEVGVLPKMDAHIYGHLHRAFSVFIFNSKGELLLQQRAFAKYHSGGLWTNTCCSHPQPGELTLDGAKRRLNEEMGVICSIEEIFEFKYNIKFSNGLIEHEYDHVFFGSSDNIPICNTEEVASWKYIAVNDLMTDVNDFPQHYTEWFKMSIKRVLDEIKLK